MQLASGSWFVVYLFVVWPGYPVWAETQEPAVLDASSARAERDGGDSTASGSKALDPREADQGETGEDGEDPGATDSAEQEDAVLEGEVGFDGPSSVSAQIERDREAQRVVGPQTLKDRLQSRYGLSLGVDFNVLAQQISQSPGKSAGVAGISGPTFSAVGGVLTNLYGKQAFAQNRVGFVAGVVDPTDYVDVYALVNPSNSSIPLIGDVSAETSEYPTSRNLKQTCR